MNEYKRFLKAGISSNIALVFTYPIDIYKINQQMIEKNKIPGIKKYYRGISRVLPLTFIDKGVKLFTYDYVKVNLKQEGFSLEGSIATSFAQSIFTNPTDVVKIRNQLNKKIPIYRGLQLTWLRDIPFNIIFFGLSDSFDNKYSKFAGSFLATALVTPVDVVKTRYCENPEMSLKNITDNMKFKDYFKGFVPRVLFTGMFYGITYNLYLYI